jgi:hypothetical protein
MRRPLLRRWLRHRRPQLSPTALPHSSPPQLSPTAPHPLDYAFTHWAKRNLAIAPPQRPQVPVPEGEDEVAGASTSTSGAAAASGRPSWPSLMAHEGPLPDLAAQPSSSSVGMGSENGSGEAGGRRRGAGAGGVIKLSDGRTFQVRANQERKKKEEGRTKEIGQEEDRVVSTRPLLPVPRGPASASGALMVDH